MNPHDHGYGHKRESIEYFKKKKRESIVAFIFPLYLKTLLIIYCCYDADLLQVFLEKKYYL